MPIIKGPVHLIGKDVAKTLPKLGGPPPGDAAEGLPRLASGAPVAPKQKEGSPDKR